MKFNSEKIAQFCRLVCGRARFEFSRDELHRERVERKIKTVTIFCCVKIRIYFRKGAHSPRNVSLVTNGH